MNRSPNPVDKHVGARVKMRRLLMGFSQEKLGEALGVTFQQVQKYEKGANRIGASRLQQISKILQVPPSFFFEGAPGLVVQESAVLHEARPAADVVSDFVSTAEGLQLNRAFARIKNPRIRRRVVDLVIALADGDAIQSDSAG